MPKKKKVKKVKKIKPKKKLKKLSKIVEKKSKIDIAPKKQTSLNQDEKPEIKKIKNFLTQNS